MKLTNLQIYNYANALLEEFGAGCDITLPVKINFFLQKNIQTLTALGKEVENARLAIVQQYGELNEEGTAYIIPADKIEAASNELNDLLNLEQDVLIRTFKIESFDNVDLTYKQMNALMFMIDDEM
jgi:hypothetical protein